MLPSAVSAFHVLFRIGSHSLYNIAACVGSRFVPMLQYAASALESIHHRL